MPMPCTRKKMQALLLVAVLDCLALSYAFAADAHPDFSGVWTDDPQGGFSEFIRNNSSNQPFTPEAKRKVDEFVALFPRNPQQPLFDDGPAQYCTVNGMPEQMLLSGAGFPMEIFQRSGVILILYEGLMDFRHLYVGDRILPPGERIPDRNGYSAARWEGDTLIVETDSMPESIDQYLYPHSDQARIVERYRMSVDPQGKKQLTADWTLTDPVFYTRPVTGTKKWVLDPKGMVLPYRCTEPMWLEHLEEKKARGVSRK